jgi:hypothetical protein
MDTASAAQQVQDMDTKEQHNRYRTMIQIQQHTSTGHGYSQQLNHVKDKVTVSATQQVQDMGIVTATEQVQEMNSSVRNTTGAGHGYSDSNRTGAGNE